MNNKYKYKFSVQLVLLCMTAMSVHSAYAAQPLITLKEMVEKTITSNPEVQARYHKFLEAGYEQDVARGNFLPSADIVSTYRNQEELVKQAGGTATPHMNNELVLRQMIFDGFATSNDVKRLGYASRTRYYELQSAMQNITLEFIRAYIDSLRYRELTQFAKDNYVVHKQLFDRIQERVTAGVARKVDLEQANGRVALAEANLLTEMTNLHDVTVRMQRLYGDLPPETLEAPTFFNNGVESSIVEALKLAYLQNPDLLSTIEDIQSKEKEIKTNEARYMPRLDLQARKNLGASSDGENNSSAADVLEITMNFNLFNGFSDRNLIKQTAEKLNSSRDMRDKACVDTRQVVSIAYNDIKQLKEQLTYREKHTVSIENAREAYRKQFDIGQRTLLDLLDTENEYFQAKRSLANTQYDMQFAYAKVYAGQGELLRKIGAARENLPEYSREANVDAESVCQAVAPEQMQVDKAALLADAKPLSNTYAALTKPLSNNRAVSSAPVTASTCSVSDINGQVSDWVTSWRKKNTDAHLKFYADKFTPESPLDKAQWIKQRKETLMTHSKIGLKLDGLQVTCNGDKASAKFKQDFTLTGSRANKGANDPNCESCGKKNKPVVTYQSNANKELQFEYVDNSWKIVRELTSN